MKAKIGKFGLVNNFLPYRFLSGNFEVVESSPRGMAEKLVLGEIDYAPVPTYFYIKNEFKLKHYSFCIASDGEVLSVVVVSRKNRIGDKIAVTAQTLTSVNLMKIILKEKDLDVKLIPSNFISASELLKIADSALVIGDEAIKARMLYRVVMDLGEEWKDLTGYPMVFGISASLKNKDFNFVDRAIQFSVEEGMKRFEEVVEEASLKFRLPVEFLVKYFKILIYSLGKKEKKGLEEFASRCRDYGL